MSEDVAQQNRRGSRQRLVRHNHTKSSSRLNKLGRAGAVPAQLGGGVGGKAGDGSGSSTNISDGSEIAGGDHQRSKSSDQLARNLSRSNLRTAKVGNGGVSAQRPRRTSNHASGTGGTSKPKAVIQLEHSDDSESGNEEFTDTDSDTEHKLAVSPRTVLPPKRPEMPHRSSSGLSVGIHPIEPTPPQISNEQVLTVTSLADMANVLNGRRSGSVFVNDGDLLSNAVTRSQSTADLARIVGDSGSRIQQNIRLRQQQRPLEYHTQGMESLAPRERRAFEKVLKEYINAKSLQNPVLRGLRRVRASQKLEEDTTGRGSVSPLGSRHSKRVGALAATTINQMADLSLDRNGSSIFGGVAGSSTSSTGYLLNQMWTQGWEDPETTPTSPENIQEQAQRVHQRMIQGRNGSSTGASGSTSKSNSQGGHLNAGQRKSQEWAGNVESASNQWRPLNAAEGHETNENQANINRHDTVKSEWPPKQQSNNVIKLV